MSTLDFDAKRSHTTHYGVGRPSDDLGRNGDFYRDEKTGTLYGPKERGRWPNGSVLLEGGDGGSPSSSGTPGAPGPPGVGVPAGGDTDWHLVKKSAADFDTEWRPLGQDNNEDAYPFDFDGSFDAPEIPFDGPGGNTTPGVITDHGALTGLDDPTDHPWAATTAQLAAVQTAAAVYANQRDAATLLAAAEYTNAHDFLPMQFPTWANDITLASTSDSALVVVRGATAIRPPSNAESGQTIEIWVVQDATGGHGVLFDAAFANPPTVALPANAVTKASWRYGLGTWERTSGDLGGTGGGSDDSASIGNGWISCADFTRTSNTTFTVSGNRTASGDGTLTPYRKLLWFETISGVLTMRFGVLASSSWNGSVTSCTLVGNVDYPMSSAPVPGLCAYSPILNPNGWPGWFNKTTPGGSMAGVVGWSTHTVQFDRYSIEGKTVTWNVEGLKGTGNNQTLTSLTAPVAARGSGTQSQAVVPYYMKNTTVGGLSGTGASSTGIRHPVVYLFGGTAAFVAPYLDFPLFTTSWANGAAKEVSFTFTYEAI